MLALCSLSDGQAETDRRIVGSGRLDGVLVASAHTDEPLFSELLADGVPFVVAGRHPNERTNCVDVDDVGGARMAVEHLVRLGHRRMGAINGPMSMAHGKDRLLGYRQALEAHGLGVEDQLVTDGDDTEEGGTIGVRRLQEISPTAVFACSDVRAVGALKALQKAGVRVPRDVALVGFDDLSLRPAVEPALTTVHQPIEHLGSMAAGLQLNLLESPDRLAGKQARRPHSSAEACVTEEHPGDLPVPLRVPQHVRQERVRAPGLRPHARRPERSASEEDRDDGRGMQLCQLRVRGDDEQVPLDVILHPRELYTRRQISDVLKIHGMWDLSTVESIPLDVG